MANSWFVKQGGKDFGPFTDDQLRQLVSQGKVGPNDHVFNSARQQWLQANQVVGLFFPQHGSPVAAFPAGSQFPSAVPAQPNYGTFPISASTVSNYGRKNESTRGFSWTAYGVVLAVGVLIAGSVGLLLALKENRSGGIAGSDGNATKAQASVIPAGFRTQLLRYLEVSGELDAASSQGFSKDELSQHLARVKATYSVTEPMWPATFKPDAKKMNESAIKGWELALRYWNNPGRRATVGPSMDTPMTFGKNGVFEDVANVGGILKRPDVENGYFDYVSYAGDALKTEVWTNDDVSVKFISPTAFKHNVQVLLSVASSHFNESKSLIIPELSE